MQRTYKYVYMYMFSKAKSDNLFLSNCDLRSSKPYGDTVWCFSASVGIVCCCFLRFFTLLDLFQDLCIDVPRTLSRARLSLIGLHLSIQLELPNSTCSWAIVVLLYHGSPLDIYSIPWHPAMSRIFQIVCHIWRPSAIRTTIRQVFERVPQIYCRQQADFLCSIGVGVDIVYEEYIIRQIICKNAFLLGVRLVLTGSGHYSILIVPRETAFCRLISGVENQITMSKF